MARSRAPLWAKLALLALPAAIVAALALAATVALSASIEPGEPTGDVISASFFELARHAARAAVFAGAPLALVSLVALLVIGAYRREPRRDDEEESASIPSLLGRLSIGSALVAAVGLLSQFLLAAQVSGWSP